MRLVQSTRSEAWAVTCELATLPWPKDGYCVCMSRGDSDTEKLVTKARCGGSRLPDRGSANLCEAAMMHLAGAVQARPKLRGIATATLALAAVVSAGGLPTMKASH